MPQDPTLDSQLLPNNRESRQIDETAGTNAGAEEPLVFVLALNSEFNDQQTFIHERNNLMTIIFAQKTFNVPTPSHASQTPEEIKANFIAMLKANSATRAAIKQAAAGLCVLVVRPSRNPNANAVYESVLTNMIQYHKAAIEQEAMEREAARAEREQAAQQQPVPAGIEDGVADEDIPF